MTTSLVEWLRTQSDEMLAGLLRSRPDLAVPPPADLTVLATRASIRASVHRACDDLDTVTLAVVEALIVAGADEEPADRAEIARLLGPDVPADILDTALATLRSRALVWEVAERLVVIPAAREVLPAYPGGLGPPAPGPATSADLPAQLAALAPEERRLLDALVAGPPVGHTRSVDDPSSPVGRLVSRGLLVRGQEDRVELPRQVGIALRGERPMGRIAAVPPEVPVIAREPELIDRTAGGASLELLRRVERLIEHWGATPPVALRSGGLGVRELRRTARELDLDEAGAALIVEVAHAADLIGLSDSSTPEWMPTTAADVWSAAGPEQRWVRLARAWLELPRLPGLVGSRDDADRPIPALAEMARRPAAAVDRRRVLEALAALPTGSSVRETAAIATLLAWRSPRRGRRMRDELVGWTFSEGTLMGVVALGALSGPGRALLEHPADNPAPAIAALRAVLPEPVSTILLQADLTAVAPGPLAADLARELRLLADVESAGGATVYRFSEAGIRRALDAGRTVAEIHELLTTRSTTPVPQALTYLIEDVGRRHGRLRGGPAGCFLRSDDEVLVAEALAHPGTAQLRLQRIAPTVAVSPFPLAEVLAGLRAAGFAPVAEDSSGVVMDLGAAGARTEPRGSRGRPPQFGLLSEKGIDTLIDRMRVGDALSQARRGTPAPADGGSRTLATLQEAARAQRRVWIGFVDGHGVAGERVLAPLSVGGGVVEGLDAVGGEIYRLPLHRITQIAVIQD